MAVVSFIGSSTDTMYVQYTPLYIRLHEARWHCVCNAEPVGSYCFRGMVTCFACPVHIECVTQIVSLGAFFMLKAINMGG